jgi:hypothetical protein
VRFLALGGDEATPVHERGVRVRGAVIDGDLNFQGRTLAGDFALWYCELNGRLTLLGARTRTVHLGGSRCQDIAADRLEAAGGVFLRDGFIAEGAVRFLGADIKGNLECDDGRFEGGDKSGNALQCDRIQVGGGAFLRNGFAACGAVRLVGADIGGDVVCVGGTFGALPEEPRGAQDEQEKQMPVAAESTEQPLILARTTVKGTLWLGEAFAPATFHGGVDLTGASINRIVDAVTTRSGRRPPDATPAGAGKNPCILLLDGLTYARFGENTDVSAPARIAFLRLQEEDDLGKNFKPQPWTQMIKTLRDMGYEDDARAVAVAKQDQQRKAWIHQYESRRVPFFRRTPLALHWLYGLVTQYGYRPSRLFGIAFVTALLFALIYAIAASYGIMAPTERAILEKVKDRVCRPELGGNWTKCAALKRQQYWSFDPIIYSFDQILPVVATQYAKKWTPMTRIACRDVGKFGICWQFAGSDQIVQSGYWIAGVLVWLLARLENLAGWVFGLMFVAIAGGLIKKD